MQPEYVKAFIIGSSWPLFITYFYIVSTYDEIRNYSFKNYVMVAPLFLGLLNVLGLYIAKQYDVSRMNRFVITGIIGAIVVSITITLSGAYKFTTQKEWINQYIGLFLIYAFTFVIIANNTDNAF